MEKGDRKDMKDFDPVDHNRKIWEDISHGKQVMIHKPRFRKQSFDWMILWMCLGFAISFILGYLACLIRSL